MATARLTEFENFLLQFDELKRLTRDDPKRIPWLWKQSNQLQEIGEDFDTLHYVVEWALIRAK